MYSFEGTFRTQPQVSLGGRSHSVSHTLISYNNFNCRLGCITTWLYLFLSRRDPYWTIAPYYLKKKKESFFFVTAGILYVFIDIIRFLHWRWLLRNGIPALNVNVNNVIVKKISNHLNLYNFRAGWVKLVYWSKPNWSDKNERWIVLRIICTV